MSFNLHQCRNFFSGSLAKFNITSQTRSKARALKSSNMRETVAAIGDGILNTCNHQKYI